MSHPIKILFDANLLVSVGLTDLILSIADRELFNPLWSEEILNEVRRFGVKTGVKTEALENRLRMMNEYFPDGKVDNYESITETLECKDPNDRHVLAAAIKGGASILVTENISDFPLDIEEKYSIEIMKLDDFLELQFSLAPELVCIAIALLILRLKNPPFTVEEYVEKIKIRLPSFHAHLKANISNIEFHLTILGN